MNRYAFRTGLAMAGATALALAACDDGTRQVAAPEPAPLAELASISELPYAEPAKVEYSAPERGYQWAERAYGMQRAVYDTPPDYGFAYDDVEPYVWETSDDWALYAEPENGDYRYYYYEPGEAYPYFVRDHDYGYAYGPTGLLVAVFYANGGYAPADVAYRVAPAAGRYWARGHGLRQAGLRAPRLRVDDRVWVDDAPRVMRSADPWLRAARDDHSWRAWRARDDDRELRRFTAETRRREVEAQAWRARAAQLPPPSNEARQDRRRELQQTAQAERLDRQQGRMEARAADQAARNAAAVERRQDARAAQEAQRAQQAQARQADREQGRAQVQRQQAERQQAQAEQRRQQQTQRQQAQAERRQQGQAEAQRQARENTQAQRQQAQVQQRQQAQVQQRQQQAQQREARAQAQAEQRRGQMEQHRQMQAQQQAQARESARRQGEQQRQQARAQQEQARSQQRAQQQAERQAARPQAHAPSAQERGKPAAAHARPQGKGQDRKD